MNCQGYNRRGLDYYGMSTGYSYKCSPMSLIQCQNLEQNSDTEVVQFRPGKQCAEVGCGEKCGCTYRNNTYTFGQEFRIGCQTCTCTIRGSVTCRCMRYNFRRREIRDMTKEELELYQTGKLQNTTDVPLILSSLKLIFIMINSSDINICHSVELDRICLLFNVKIAYDLLHGK